MEPRMDADKRRLQKIISFFASLCLCVSFFYFSFFLCVLYAALWFTDCTICENGYDK